MNLAFAMVLLACIGLASGTVLLLSSEPLGGAIMLGIAIVAAGVAFVRRAELP